MDCVHKKAGCLWGGEVSQLNAHLETCEFDLMDCPSNCGNKVSHIVLQEHLIAKCSSKYSKRCEYCGAIFSVESETTHVATCTLLPVPCPYNCVVVCVPRGHLNHHLNEDCERNIQKCPFNDVGCEYECSKNKSSKHLETNLETHLLKLNIAFMQVQQTVNKLNEENKRIKAENERLNTGLSQLTLTVNKQNVENIELKSEIERMKNENELTWIIGDFKERLSLAKHDELFGKVFSPSFYSHRNGYKMRLELFWNGYGDGILTHLSLYWMLMKGEFDNQLEWPFPHKVVFTLLDQSSDAPVNLKKVLVEMKSKNIQKPKQEFNDAWGYSKFISHEDLYKRNYIKDDKIIIKAEVTKK